MNKCIWCKKENQDIDIEHIFPEALGCPDGFYLDQGCVCKKCNNGLAHLDRVVIGDFEIPAFMAGVPRKNNKPAKVTSFGNLSASIIDSKKTFFINMDKNKPFTFPNGEKLPPFRNRERDIKGNITTTEDEPNISFDFEIGKSRKFHRGIVKIAFSILAKAFEAKECNKDKYDHVRKFVRSGKGEIPILLIKSQTNDYRTQSWNPYISKDGDYTVTFRLATIDFIVDFSKNHQGFLAFREKMKETYAENFFTWLPLNI